MSQETQRPAVGPKFWKGIATMAVLYAALGLIAWCLLATVQRAKGDAEYLIPDKVKLEPARGATSPYSDNRDDALEELNAMRRARGLPAYVRDESLTQAARAAAKYRAERHMFGHAMDHPMGDFRFLPNGATAASAGCAAYPASYGWLSCDMWERNKYAGAAWWPGTDGKRYMHIFIK